MNDLELIALLVAGLYIFESLRAVGADALLFSGGSRRRFRVHDVRSRGLLLRTGRGIVHTGLSPLGSFVVAEAWPLTLTLEGVEGRAPHPIAPRVPDQVGCWRIAWPDLSRIEADGSVLCLDVGEREAQRVRFSSAGAARWWARRLVEIAAAPPEDRHALLRACYAATLDVAQVRGLHEQVARQTARLCMAGAGLLLYLLLFVPLTQVLRVEIGRTGIALGYLALVTWGMIEIYLAYARVLPTRPLERWLATLLLPVYPAAAMRAAAGLHAEAMGHFHPLALAIALAQKADRDEIVRRVAAGLRYFATDGPATHALVDVAEAHAIDLRAEPHPPAAPDPSSGAFCPYCLLQTMHSGGCCPDCVTVPLLPHASAIA